MRQMADNLCLGRRPREASEHREPRSIFFWLYASTPLPIGLPVAVCLGWS